MVPDQSTLWQHRPEGKSRKDRSSLLLAPSSPSLGDFQLPALGRWAAGRQELGPPCLGTPLPAAQGWWCPGSTGTTGTTGSREPQPVGRGRKVQLLDPCWSPTLNALPGFKVSSFYRTFLCPQMRGIRMQKVLVLQTNSKVHHTLVRQVLVVFYR